MRGLTGRFRGTVTVATATLCVIGVGLIASAAGAGASGNLSLLAGVPTASPTAISGDGGVATVATLNRPEYAAIDSSGNILWSEEVGSVIQVLAKSTLDPGYALVADCGAGSSACHWTKGHLYTIAGNVNDSTYRDGAVATATWIGNPAGFTFDASGNVIVAARDLADIVVVALSKVNPGYRLSHDCGSGSSVCVWKSGHVYTIGGTGKTLSTGFNNSDFTTDGRSALSTSIDTPNDVALDHDGNVIYGNDQYGGNIRVIAVGADPGYTLGDYCGAASAPCTWRDGDTYLLAGCVLDAACAQQQTGDVTFTELVAETHGIIVDALGDVIFANSDDETVRVLALGPTNPGYALEATCGPVGDDTCTWESGNVYDIAGDYHPGDSSPDGTPGTRAVVEYAGQLAIDALGNLLITNVSATPEVQVLDVHACTKGCPYGLASMHHGDVYDLAGGGTGTTSPWGVGGPATSADLAPSASGRHYPFGVVLSPLLDEVVIVNGMESDVVAVNDNPAIAPLAPTSIKVVQVGTTLVVTWKSNPASTVKVNSFTATAVPGNKSCTAAGTATKCVIKGVFIISSGYVVSVVAKGAFGTSPAATHKLG